jgi:hemerythrin
MLDQLRQDDDDPDKFIAILNTMMDFAQLHFKSEEEIMKNLDYPRLEQHRNQHIKSLEALTNFCMDIFEKRIKTKKQVLEFLESWIEDHHAKADSQLGRFIKACKGSK